jgi:HSP20 family protein
MKKHMILLSALVLVATMTVNAKETVRAKEQETGFWSGWIMEGAERIAREARKLSEAIKSKIASFAPAVTTGEIEKNKKKYFFIEVELPGYKKDDINVEIKEVAKQKIIVIKAKKKVLTDVKTKTGVKKESIEREAHVERTLPEHVNFEKPKEISRKYETGVLRIEMPIEDKPEKKETVIKLKL